MYRSHQLVIIRASVFLAWHLSERRRKKSADILDLKIDDTEHFRRIDTVPIRICSVQLYWAPTECCATSAG